MAETAELTELTELKIERILDAPREVVWKAFTDPEEIALWFGPIGWSCPRESISVDARVGGHSRMTMVNQEDPTMTSPGDGIFDEVVENELLVGHEDFDEKMAEVFGAPRMTLRIELYDAGANKTRLVLTQGPYTEEFERMARAGWLSSFTKLDNIYLARLGLLEQHQSSFS